MGAEFRFRPRVFELDGSLEPWRALSAFGPERRAMLFDSAAGEPRRASLLLFDPLERLRDCSTAAEAFPRMREALGRIRPQPGDTLPGPFAGGLAAALAYDLGASGERPVRAAPEPFGQPRLVGGTYVDFLVRDEELGRTFLVLGDDPGDGRPDVAVRRRQLERELAAACAAPHGPTKRFGQVVRHTPPEEHRRRIESLRASIARGELYQANLAHRLTAEVGGAPEDWYARLRAANPAPYMGFARWDDGALLSSSPELFFELAGREARTRPIKGTIARAEDPVADAERAARLLASEKDQAELAMIVDLERNDLGRIAVPGGVRVEGFPSLRSYARVHHLMADVVARLKPEVDAFDVLAALFPGGSITGAPKFAAMDEIARLELEGRGFFCGSLGFVGLDGQAAFNILIRTMLWRPAPQGAGASSPRGELSLRVGGGITWPSNAASEEAETLAKAAGMLAAVADSEP